MNYLAFGALAFAALTDMSHDPAALMSDPLQTSASPNLMSALRTSDVAHIYIVSRHFLYPGDLGPDDVRSEGCAYRVDRESPEWAELERTLARADVRIVPGTRRQDVRVGLVLSRALGTVWEIYSSDLDWPNGQRPGVSQGQLVEVSPSFANLLHVFVALHPELALPDAGRVEHCPRAARGAP